MNDQPAIIANSLTKRFGDFTAVDNVNFEVHHGEIFGFLGPNGSGKTTTIRMMLGLMKPTSGEVDVLGMKVDGDTTKIRPRVGYMSQRFSLYNDLTVLQNLNFYGAAYGLKNSELGERIQNALELAGLQGREHAKTKELSGGWRQRLALSAAILHRPEVLFLGNQLVEQVPEGAPGNRIDACGGLVEKEHFGTVQDGGAKCQALAPSPRQVFGFGVLATFQPGHCERILDTFL